VRAAPEGDRNRQLNRSTFNLRTFEGVDVSRIRQVMLASALDSGLPESEAKRTIESALAGGAKAESRSGPTRDRADYVRTVNGSAAKGGGASNGSAYEPPGPSDETAAPVKSEIKTPRIVIEGTDKIFEPLPPMQWTVEGLQIGPGRPTLIVGYGASAKTLAVQALALGVASGTKVWGHFETTPGRVLHIDYEQGSRATRRRYQRLALGMNLEADELMKRLEVSCYPAIRLDDGDAREVFAELAYNYDLIVFDSLRAGLARTDENDSRVRTYVDQLSEGSELSGTAFALIHHAGKPRDAHKTDARSLSRGSGAIFDASGSVFNFVSKPGTSARTVTQVKTPAEAEEGAIAPFEIVVEDVAVDGVAKAGLRVVYRQVDRRGSTEDAERMYEVESSKLVEFITRNPGKSQSVIVAKAGVTRAKTRTLDLLKALEDEGRIRVTAGEKNSKRYYAVPPPPGAAK
jgi:hypothetical protein